MPKKQLTASALLSKLLTLATASTLFNPSAWALPSDTTNHSNDAIELENITISGEESEEITLLESAKSVDLIDTTFEKKLTADMGEVLARMQGVGVRRSGGLGSSTRFSLNGLTDDQIRFFVDGIPIEMSGYTLGISNVPINLMQRVEIYHGVVPIQFGADALGGAVNMVTVDEIEGTHGNISHQMGDFGTRRSTLSLTHLEADTGFYARYNGFADASDNDYEVDVRVPDELGRPQPVTVKRFHDTYEASGHNFDLGLIDQSWADRFQISMYSSEYDKDIQHNINMSLPYGEATFKRETQGVNVRYEHIFSEQLTLMATAGDSETKTRFKDIADYSYNWLGEEIITPIAHPGEIGEPSNSITWSDSQFARVNLNWNLKDNQQVKLSLAPTWNDRTGKELLLSEGDHDPLTADRELYTFVTGIEHTIDLLNDRFQNIFFVKHYRQEVRSEEPIDGTTIFRREDRDTSRNGWGNAMRYRFNDWSYGKMSYEYATRLPRPDEIFGDSVLIHDNLELEEETSHNYNLGLSVDGLDTNAGTLRADTNLFLRDADNLITLLGSDKFFTYQNLYSARSTGVQAAAGWTSLAGLIDFDVNFTSIDFRNTSNDGTFAKYDGDRIPNRPYLFANSTLRLNWTNVLANFDELSATWNFRFVEEYDLIWESVGIEEFKQVVPSQEIHSFGLTYTRDLFPYTFNVTAEVQNLTNNKLYDFYGVQRPGRAFYLKGTFEF